LRRKQRERRDRRAELRERNGPVAELARSFGFWFPYSRDAPKWLSDPLTRDLAPSFLGMVRAARAVLVPQRCVMQYVPKRRLTRQSATQIPENMRRIARFLEENRTIQQQQQQQQQQQHVEKWKQTYLIRHADALRLSVS